MTTTIQVEDDTLDLLKRYKEQLKLKTYDDVIKGFMQISDYAKSANGLFGKRDIYYIQKQTRLLRDKKDRF